MDMREEGTDGASGPLRTIPPRVDPASSPRWAGEAVLAIVYTYAIFASGTWWGMLALTLIMIAGYLIGRVPMKLAIKPIKPLLVILVFTVIANAFSVSVTNGVTSAGETAWTIAGSFGLVPAGLERGTFYAFRIALLVMATSLVTFTTSAVKLADACTALIRPLKSFKVPVEDIGTMFSIALRFIPVTAEEAERIMTAQRARGVKFGEGGLASRVRVWLPVLVPLFVGLFRRADDLAAAMEARCYRGEGRTRLNVSVMNGYDWLVFTVGSAVLIAIGVVL